MRNRNLKYAIVCLAVLIGGCVAGNKHNYHETIADIKAQGSIAIAVATSDQRQYVLSRERRPNFVGFQRGGYGNKFNIGTASGKPLSQDMTQAIANSLEKRGFKLTSVPTTTTDNRQAVIDKLKMTNAERLLLLTVTEWMSDTYANTALLYDVTAEVLDREGKVLAKNAVEGKDNLGAGGGFDTPAYTKQVVLAAFKEKIEKLLNSPEMEAALR